MASSIWAIGTPTMTRLAARSRSGQAATSDRFMQVAGAIDAAPVAEDGVTGVDCEAAEDGVDGEEAADGVDGVDGVDGEEAADGVDGEEAADGVD